MQRPLQRCCCVQDAAESVPQLQPEMPAASWGVASSCITHLLQKHSCWCARDDSNGVASAQQVLAHLNRPGCVAETMPSTVVGYGEGVSGCSPVAFGGLVSG